MADIYHELHRVNFFSGVRNKKKGHFWIPGSWRERWCAPLFRVMTLTLNSDRSNVIMRWSWFKQCLWDLSYILSYIEDKLLTCPILVYTLKSVPFKAKAVSSSTTQLWIKHHNGETCIFPLLRCCIHHFSHLTFTYEQHHPATVSSSSSLPHH